MNNFYKFIDKLNESQEYLDMLIKYIEDDGWRLLHNLSKSFTSTYDIIGLIMLYMDTKGKSEKEFLESPFIMYPIYSHGRKELHKMIYDASKHDLNTFLKTLYHEAIDSEKKGITNFYIQEYLLRVFDFNQDNMHGKIAAKIAKNFRKYFSVDELINYITANFPENFEEINDDMKLSSVHYNYYLKKLEDEIKRKTNEAASHYLKDLLRSVIELGSDDE